MNDGMNQSVNDSSEQLLKERVQLLEDALSGGPGEAAYRSLPFEDRLELIREKFSSLLERTNSDDVAVSGLCAAYWDDYMDEATFMAVAHLGAEESFLDFVEENVEFEMSGYGGQPFPSDIDLLQKDHPASQDPAAGGTQQ